MTMPPSYHTRVQGPYNQHPTDHAAPVGDMNTALHDYMHRLQVQHDHTPEGHPVPPGHPAALPQPVQRTALIEPSTPHDNTPDGSGRCTQCGVIHTNLDALQRNVHPTSFDRLLHPSHTAAAPGMYAPETDRCPSCKGMGYIATVGGLFPCTDCHQTGMRKGASLRTVAHDDDDGLCLDTERPGGPPCVLPLLHNGPHRDRAGRTWGGHHASLHKHAHDSGDGETIFHCPFCGSGDVVGGQDGTVSCGFCKKAFTVQVQPKFKNMPQTVEGQPYNIPGMPGGGPDAGAGEQVPPPPDAAPIQDAPIDDANAGLPAPQTDDAAPPPSSDKPPWMRQSQSALLVTDQGVALPAHSVMRRMALLHADDPTAVLDDLRRDHR